MNEPDRLLVCVYSQAVAAKLHGARSFNLPPASIEALQMMPDLPDLDNTLNLLSSLSLGGEVILKGGAGAKRLFSRLWSGSDKVFPPGGHNVTGVLRIAIYVPTVSNFSIENGERTENCP